MRTKRIVIAVMAIMLTVSAGLAKDKEGKTDWSKVNFIDEYKVKFKIPGAMSKSLTENSTFVNDFTVNNALRMKGSESNAKGTVHSEVFFAGIPQDKFQAMVQELYKQFTDELSQAGLTISDGEAAVNSNYALQQNAKGKHLIGKASGDAYEDKAGISEGSIPGYGVLFVKDGVTFRPEGKNTYLCGNKIPGNFYQKLASDQNINMISIDYFLTFASFDGSRGYSAAYLETAPVLSVQPIITLVNPKGTISFIAMEKGPIWGDGDWSIGIRETELNKLEYFGLATSAKYAIEADPDKYIAEIKSIIENFQRELVQALTAEL